MDRTPLLFRGLSKHPRRTTSMKCVGRLAKATSESVSDAARSVSFLSIGGWAGWTLFQHFSLLCPKLGIILRSSSRGDTLHSLNIMRTPLGKSQWISRLLLLLFGVKAWAMLAASREIKLSGCLWVSGLGGVDRHMILNHPNHGCGASQVVPQW